MCENRVFIVPSCAHLFTYDDYFKPFFNPIEIDKHYLISYNRFWKRNDLFISDDDKSKFHTKRYKIRHIMYTTMHLFNIICFHKDCKDGVKVNRGKRLLLYHKYCRRCMNFYSLKSKVYPNYFASIIQRRWKIHFYENIFNETKIIY
jgi:hypothetical protein